MSPLHANRLVVRCVPLIALVAICLLAGCNSHAAERLSVSKASTASQCRARQLRLAATFYGEAGGQFIQTFTFSNVGRQACRMRGWPTLKLESQSRRPVPAPSRRVVQGAPTAPAFTPVTLRAGGAASFDVYGEDWNHVANRPCRRTTAVLITPPGIRVALSVRVRMPNCGVFDIAPLIAGRSDRRSWSVVWHK